MATTSKLGYGNAENLDTAITNGIIDEKDLVITRTHRSFITSVTIRANRRSAPVPVFLTATGKPMSSRTTAATLMPDRP